MTPKQDHDRDGQPFESFSAAQLKKLRDARNWLAKQVRPTGQATLQHVVCAMKYLVWMARARRASCQTPPLWPDPATRPRAAVGGVVAVVLVAFLFMAVGHRPELPKTATSGVVACEPTKPDHHLAADSSADADRQDNEQPHVPCATDEVQAGCEITEVQAACENDEVQPTTAGDAEQDQEASELAGAAEPARPQRREVGILRIPVRMPDRSFSNGQRDRSSDHRQYNPSTSARSGLDSFAPARADYARQRAIEQAQYEAERAMRNYRQQVSGSMGAMGVPWGPGSSGNPGYGESYGPSPSRRLPSVRPYGNMPSASPPGFSPWGR